MEEKIIQEIDRRINSLIEKIRVTLIRNNDYLDKDTIDTILANQQIIKELSYEKGKLETIVKVKKELLA
ncbi:hypothetical protein [Clostridium perfringens]|uniref:hypothetical protein n=1 Tax=Clostridium perfringens TaxID=1502 RepID=UPI001E3A71FE|nr:hypothetical protein [Clostridium perfringens]WVL78327.1 hypothetical protein LMS42_015295 [Clostridium perfringens]